MIIVSGLEGQNKLQLFVLFSCLVSVSYGILYHWFNKLKHFLRSPYFIKGCIVYSLGSSEVVVKLLLNFKADLDLKGYLEPKRNFKGKLFCETIGEDNHSDKPAYARTFCQISQEIVS